MKRYFLFLLLTALNISCTRSAPYEKAGYSIIKSHINTMQNDAWIAQSIGGSFYDGDIKKLNVSFIVLGENFDVDVIRSHMVNGIEKFLASINTEKKLIPYLNHYPFTDKDINYGVSLYNLEGECLGFAFIIKSNICYYKNNLSLPTWQKTTEQVYEEPYPEALQKVKAGLAVPVTQLPANPI